MTWSAADIPDQSVRVAVVTGANGGLGLEVSRELARKSAFVVMASRDQGEAEEAPAGAGQRFFRAAVIRFGMSPARGALALLRAATDPNAVGGALYTPRLVNWGPPVRRPLFGRSRNRDAMTSLWEVSEHETGITFDVKPA